MSQDDPVVLAYADNLEGTFVVCYDSVGDGDVTVWRHSMGVACDEAYTDQHVENSAVPECTGGSHFASSDKMEQAPCCSGEWLECEPQFTQMMVSKNEERG